MVEHRPDELLQRRRRKIVVQVELDLACRWGKRSKSPRAIETPKRPFAQLDDDPVRRRILVGGREIRADAVIVDVEANDRRIGRASDDPGPVAPGDELGIVFGARDQIEHLLRAVRNEHRLIDAGHCYNEVRTGDGSDGKVEAGAPMTIVENKKAYHDYFVEEKFEAGVALEGWEVKAIRAGRAQLKEAYVVVKNREIVLLGAHITPLATASTHIRPDPTRTRKLLMHRVEINRLIGKVERAGYTLTPLNLHFTKGRIKLEVGLARGKKQYDKREAEKLRDWDREKQRLLRNRTGDSRRTRSP